MFAPTRPEIGSLFDKFAGQFPVLRFQFVYARQDFRVHELTRRVSNHPMLFIEIFWRKDFGRASALRLGSYHL
jgi:hypothetical protein